MRRKEYGLRFSKDTVEPMPWNVADVLSLDGAYFSYCGWAIHVDGWLGNAKLRNIWSYLAAFGWLFKSGTIGQYDWDIADVTSQADGWNSSAAPLYIATAQDLTLARMSLNGLHDAWNPQGRRGPIVHLVLNSFVYDGREAYRGHVRLNQVTLFGSLTDGVLVEGSGGFVDMRDVHIGSTGTQDFYGNVAPNISGSIVNNKAWPAVDVAVDGGFAVSALPDKSRWFIGASARNLRGYNPVGVLTAPFASSAAVPTLAPSGETRLPARGVHHTVLGTPISLFVSGGNDVEIEVSSAGPLPH